MFVKIYDWVIGLAARPRAKSWLSVLSFTESSFFPIPPDVLLAPMCLAKPAKGWHFATICTASSVLGGMAGYLIGKLAFSKIEPWLMSSHYAEAFTHAVESFDTWGFWYILLAGFTPIPYKVFTISAGVVGMPLPAFVLGSVAGRGGRFFLVAGLIRLGGEDAAKHLRKYVDLIGWLVLALAVIVLLVIKFGGVVK